MNTDQAFELLRDAGVTEDICINVVRRWLRERKINYEGNVQQKSGYILENTKQAINMLSDAGVAESIGNQVVQRWLMEGKIQTEGIRKRVTEYIPDESASKRYLNEHTEKDKIIRQLKVTIKAQNEQIKEIEQLYKTSTNTIIKQRDKLNKEIVNLENEKSQLQREANNLLKENIQLRNQLIKLKDELLSGNKKDPDKAHATLPPKVNDYYQKLGLSKTASHKEVLTGYKKLLKVTHPDHGGHASAFHYIKTEYDNFRNSNDIEKSKY